ncbi:hypothetical protein [Myxococcus xanthus]|uniref:hypothetical protein n=1 Tax=Myxococcus xanthus TaxID=34 RepID=UPI0002E8670E|nr:hypothetical protein [Myxococcus xanthus]UYI16477.1 hypothetical protein N3T43_09210 [Myxococcus xanthus]UYI23839.1 hypothetical protein N1129_09210 [Myxococcus xanthus]
MSVVGALGVEGHQGSALGALWAYLPRHRNAETDKVLVLEESNSAFRLDGVGYRGLGNLRDVGLQPPADWWTRNEVWTWRRICSTYPFRRQAWLKVKAHKLSRL